MSLKVGGLDVVGVFVGDAAAKVYVGAMKIWPPVPDFTPFTISSEDPGYEDLIDEQVPEGRFRLLGNPGRRRGGWQGWVSRRYRHQPAGWCRRRWRVEDTPRMGSAVRDGLYLHRIPG
ncbi:minor tail protein [Mycobacterium phage Ringer]|nr:minor tail protein [Mycobacterium phage Ringer]